MSKSNESGHGKNVALFEELFTYCVSYGAAYNPGNPDISIVGLTALKGQIIDADNAVSKAKAAYAHITNEREIAFLLVPKFFTKISLFLKSSGVSKQKLEDARTLIRKVNGTAKLVEKEEPVKETTEVPSAENNEDITLIEKPKKVSRQKTHKTFDNLLETLKGLIDLLETETNYKPNEPEMTIGGLQGLYSDLHNRTIAVHEASAEQSRLIIERNRIFYLADNNLCERVNNAKSYVKAIFGTNSEQYRKIAHIKLYNFASQLK